MDFSSIFINSLTNGGAVGEKQGCVKSLDFDVVVTDRFSSFRQQSILDPML